MADHCLTCARASSSEELTYTCDGFCKRWAHRSCLGVSSAAVKDLIKEDSQILWLCHNCSENRRNGHSVMIAELTAALTDLKSQLSAEFQTRMDAAAESLKRTMLSSLDQHTDTRPASHTSTFTIQRKTSTSKAPVLSSTPATELSNPAKRRLMDRSPPSVVATSPLLNGTAPIATSAHATLLLLPETPKFWLYLSRCRPTATILEVETFVKEQIGIEDVTVFKLVPLNRDVRTLTFSSFKVGLSPDYKEKALLCSSWPIGTVFKEFTDRRNAPISTLSTNPLTTTTTAPTNTQVPVTTNTDVSIHMETNNNITASTNNTAVSTSPPRSSQQQ
uniref:uncharacterized protein LOC125906649 n=1 Tax=Anopheles coluzzii TaxID=1518534 RepID=UPI0020FF8720|nr:uncharacterized protein LOC125906649 [Anopheles coluzzii]